MTRRAQADEVLIAGVLALAPEPLRRDDERRPRVYPLAAVLALGERATRIGAVVGISLALLTHAAGAARAVTALWDMRRVVQDTRAVLHELIWTNYEVEVDRPKPAPTAKPAEPPPPEPEPEPVLAPAPRNDAPKPAQQDDPYDSPPAPAQASKILTAKDDPDEPVDLTDQGFVSGDGTGPGYGRVSAAGTSTVPTFSPDAKLGGTPGGTGKGSPGPKPAPGPDRSRPPGLTGGTAWSCPFPAEADAEQIDQAVAVIMVTVRPDGTPLSVRVVTDPGHGFGRAARLCALGRRYEPGLDRDGAPVTSTSPPIKVRFTR